MIIYKPQHVAIREDLLRAAARLNPDGWGLMGFNEGRLRLRRHEHVNLDQLLAVERELRGAEYVLHLRQRTRGSSDASNVHPFEVSNGLYLMHNGTLHLRARVPGQSDSWHLAHDVLRPLTKHWRGLFVDPAFRALLEAALPKDNELVLLDHVQRSIVIVNRHHGVEFEGLWLSNRRWIDRTLFSMGLGASQERSYSATDVRFL